MGAGLGRRQILLGCLPPTRCHRRRSRTRSDYRRPAVYAGGGCDDLPVGRRPGHRRGAVARPDGAGSPGCATDGCGRVASDHAGRFGGGPVHREGADPATTTALRTSSAPSFGVHSAPSFGARSAPSFGVRSAPSFGARSAPSCTCAAALVCRPVPNKGAAHQCFMPERSSGCRITAMSVARYRM